MGQVFSKVSVIFFHFLICLKSVARVMFAYCYYYNINGMFNASVMQENLSSRILFVVCGTKICGFLVGRFFFWCREGVESFGMLL